MADDTYEIPREGWVCFFCGERFPTHYLAGLHFGADPDQKPGCLMRLQGGDRFALVALREEQARAADLERELARYRDEDGPKDREIAAIHGRHAEALRAQEEKGYAKGLRDGTDRAARIAETTPLRNDFGEELIARTADRHSCDIADAIRDPQRD